ncbi:MAG: alanine racemase [Candidatus Hodarchaeales archaeon]
MLEIEKPTAIINEKKVRRNIERMTKKAKKSNNVRFRPHFKTHQSADIGEWFRDYGVSAITVSSVDMAEYFINHGWDDITVAVPVNIKQLDKINKLSKTVYLNLLVESIEAVKTLEKISNESKVWIEIDVGYKRTGVNWKDTERIDIIANTITKTDKLQLVGILTHAGHAYNSHSVAELKKIHNDSVYQMNSIRKHLTSRGYDNIEISIGDTPTCSVVDDLSGVDEIRPGNFVFNDLMQVNIGSCEEEDIALVVGCPVIAKYPKRNELVIYGGGVHLSKDFIVLDDGSKSFGSIALPTEEGWSTSVENAYVSSPSQEHGVIKAEEDFIEKTNVGDIFMILPIHSCLTANLYQKMKTLEGQNLSTFNY